MKDKEKNKYRLFGLLLLMTALIMASVFLIGKDRTEQPIVTPNQNYFYYQYTHGNCNVFQVRGSYDMVNKVYTDWLGNKSSRTEPPNGSFICYNYI